MPHTPEDRTAAARTALEQVCSGRDPEGIERIYHPDFVDHVNHATHHGHDGVRNSIAFYQRVLTDLRFTVMDQVTEGSKVASRFTVQGTYRERPVKLHGIVISRFHEGRIIEDWAVTETLELLRQLGPARALLLLARLWRDARRL
jgi:predicted ester cyclase